MSEREKERMSGKRRNWRKEIEGGTYVGRRRVREPQRERQSAEGRLKRGEAQRIGMRSTQVVFW